MKNTKISELPIIAEQERVILFGAGHIARSYIMGLRNDVEIVAVADNDKNKHGTFICGHKVVPAEDIIHYSFDRIVITLNDRLGQDTTNEGSRNVENIYEQLTALGIDGMKISLQYIYISANEPRVVFVKNLSELLRGRGGDMAVAECGVFRGEFAGYINEYFFDRTLYLFDTFKGFSSDDISEEIDILAKEWASKSTDALRLKSGSELIALLRCRNRDRVIVKKGQIPKSLLGCENECFAFVNLDMDLYAPTLAALRFFAPRIVSGGVILLHDYYYQFTPGIKRAVDEFSKERNFALLPIGDDYSVAMIFTARKYSGGENNE